MRRERATREWPEKSNLYSRSRPVKRCLGDPATKGPILSHHENLNRDYLVDDRLKHGADRFEVSTFTLGRKSYLDGRRWWNTSLKDKVCSEADEDL